MNAKRKMGLEDAFLARLKERNASLKVRNQRQFASGGCPSGEDLADSFSFNGDDNNIWLAGQRVMLMQADVFGAIRRELIDRMGIDATRRLLTRMGWQAGARDASRVSELWPDGDDVSLFSAGPRLHKLKGMIDIEIVQIEIDNACGHFYGEFLWYDSLEASQHVAGLGISSEPVCWMQLGYASGYASALLGRDVIFREVECTGCGHEHCRIIGKPADEWGDLQESTFTEVVLYQGNPDTDVQLGQRNMVGGSPAFLVATRLLTKVAPTNATVLLTGESGVGKEMFARALHQQSRRNNKPLVALNCAALPETLLEAELFGVEKGAFTGADKSRPGRFERASGGTLFLDEISTLSLTAQGKILRVIQEGELERIGGSRVQQVDVRIIAATNVDLREEVAAGRFREDLFYRLNVFPIHLPPLRQRREDLPLLMSHFLQHYCQQYQRKLTGFTTRLVNSMLSYSFPGNIRELQNLIERGVIIAEDGDVLDINHLVQGGESERLMWQQHSRVGNHPSSHGQLPHSSEQHDTAAAQAGTPQLANPLASLQTFLDGGAADPASSLTVLETLLIDQALTRASGNVSAAAQLLGMTRAQLSYRLKGRNSR